MLTAVGTNNQMSKSGSYIHNITKRRSPKPFSVFEGEDIDLGHKSIEDTLKMQHMNADEIE